jgi:hypothetical protein
MSAAPSGRGLRWRRGAPTRSRIAARLRPVFLFESVRTRRVRPDEITADPELRTLRNLNTREDYQALADRGVLIQVILGM